MTLYKNVSYVTIYIYISGLSHTRREDNLLMRCGDQLNVMSRWCKGSVKVLGGITVARWEECQRKNIPRTNWEQLNKSNG